MGLGRVIWTGCLGMCCLIPCAWIAFRFFDLGAAITGGIFIDVGPAIELALTSFLPNDIGALQGIIPFLVNAIVGLLLIVFFPIHWSLIYRPDAVDFAIAILIPWILSGVIISALFCKSAKKGFDSAMAIGIGYAIIFGSIPFIIQGIIGAIAGQSGGGDPLGGFSLLTVFDGVFGGLTDLGYVPSVLFSCLEGGFVAGVFASLVGALKYKPEEQISTSDKPTFNTAEPKIGTKSTGGMKCTACGTKVKPGDTFCPQCGSSI